MRNVTRLPEIGGLMNHKGQSCLYKKILCQEGFCSGCQIYIEAMKRVKRLIGGVNDEKAKFCREKERLLDEQV